MRTIIFISVVLLMFGIAFGQSDSVVAEAMTRCVYIEVGNSHGAGVILSTNRILTNYHVVDGEAKVLVNGHEAIVLKVSKELDLALLVAPTRAMPQVRFAEVRLTEPVFVIGNPLHHRGLVSFGRVVDVKDEFVYTDTMSLAGMSGAGVWNYRSELVGIAEALESAIPPIGDVISRTVRASVIQDFLK